MTSIVRRPTRSLLPRLLGPELDHVFGDFLLEPFSLLPTISLAPLLRDTALAPRVDVYETDTDVVVKAELPGVLKEDLEVTSEDSRHLRLKGQSKREEEVKDMSTFRCERVYGQFERLVHLPADVGHERISAKLENGVLAIRAPKKEPEPRGTKVEIQ